MAFTAAAVGLIWRMQLSCTLFLRVLATFNREYDGSRLVARLNNNDQTGVELVVGLDAVGAIVCPRF